MASLLGTVRDLDRLRQIVTVLVRHGFGEVAARTGLGAALGIRTEGEAGRAGRPSAGERLRMVLTDLGPTFVKLGQLLSTRPDVLPEDVVRELRKLQDEVPPVPWEQLRASVEQELGAPVEQFFEAFDPQPLASASIGQVHRARLRPRGSEHAVDVAVKIQRPGIRDVIERDIDLLYWLARAIESSIPESRVYSPIKLVGEFERAIRAELDFVQEADHAERFAHNFEGHPEARFPRIHREASGRRVLTLEFLHGKKVHDAVAAGADAALIARRALKIIVKQIFEDGFFHADPHPGNVFIVGPPDDPVIAMVDLGLVGRLTPRMRDLTVDLMVAAVRRDYRAIADALYALGRPTKKIDRQAFEAEVAVLADRYLGKRLQDIELSALVRDLVQGATKYGVEIPPDFLLVGKALMTVEGVGKEIYPELDVFEEVKPYFLDLLRRRYSPERLSQDLVRHALRLSNAASDVPLLAQEILEDVRKGELTVRVSEPHLASAADLLGRRIFSAILVASLYVGGAILVATGRVEGYVLGGLAITAGLSWASGHVLLAWWLGRRQRRGGS
ncbi:MAG: AarF/ABC1/UbiB kinase family protein [Myxococcota bacterium]|nr:AarF/ABC1/UbiB kinase family protein [Myxococcota bacterium]MDW8363448.1 AarF/ABC1/UbiB kinase family protein [Myxococcales bacterium]